MSHLVRSRIPPPSLSSTRRRRTLLGIGALAAAGLAGTLAHGQQRPFGLGFGAARSAHSHLHDLLLPRPISALAHRSLFSLASILDSASPPHMASLTPPQPPPKWTHTPEEVESLTKAMIDKDRKLMDAIAALKAEDCNFDTVRPHSRSFAFSRS